MEYFSTESLSEHAEIFQDEFCGLQHHGLEAGDMLEALHSCLAEPSIFSIFEQSPNEEVKIGVDEESEATLLTALTEILDSVDDENLSPFDTLPDAELLQGQKGHEHLRRLMSLSRSPSEKESLLTSRRFPGKTLPFVSTGSLHCCDKEKHIGVSSSTLKLDLDLSSIEELDCCLPVLLEQEGESLPISFSELVKHMHPCSVSVCVDGEEQLLPEGGIVLEVVDKGEHGEPILAIPDLSVPLSLSSGGFMEGEQKVPESSTEKASIKPEVLPDVEALFSEVSLVKNDGAQNVTIKQSKKGLSKKCPLKKKKRKTDESVVEQKLLRNATSEKVNVFVKEPLEELKKKKVTFAPVSTVSEPESCKTVKVMEAQATEEKGSISTSPSAEVTPRKNCTELIEPKPLAVSDDKQIPVASPPDECGEADVSSKEELTVSQPKETKPKSLSLQQYRLLRRNNKPSPPEKTGNNMTKWPLLPEAPRELPPIPCLPDPNPRDRRHAVPYPAKKESAPEIMPAWQPRGPGAPPTPEALLVPPALMLGSSRKPESSQSVPQPLFKPAENLVTSTNSSVLPNPQNLPVSTKMPQNTIHNKVSPAAKQTPLEVPVSLLDATTNGAPQSLNATGQTKFLQDALSISKQVIKVIPSAPLSTIQGVSLSTIQGVSLSQATPEITTRTTTNIQTSAVPKMPKAAVPVKRAAEQTVGAPLLDPGKSVSTTRPTAGSQHHVAPIATLTSAPIQARIVKLAEQMRMAAVPKAKSPTTESFTSEIGIEAADLTSLLEQFEETQPKGEQSVPEVCGRAAAVGNSSVGQQADIKALKKPSSPDLSSTAGLTPPATPPHQMWKPLASLDHDYCLLPKEASQNELGSRWNIKQQSSIIIKSIELPSNHRAPQPCESKLAPTPTIAGTPQKKIKPGQNLIGECQYKKESLTSTVMVTPDASLNRRDSECSLQDEHGSRHQRFQEYSEHSPSPYHHKRSRSQRMYRTWKCSSSGSRSSSSESSRSHSCSPSRKRYRFDHSRSRSRSPSRCRSRSPPRRRRYSYSSSCSGSWSRSQSRSQSRSRSRSQSPGYRLNSHSSLNHRSSYHCGSRDCNEDIRRHKEKAIEERRVVYIGRIHGSMTRKELRERFSYFGEIEDCTVHFRDQGDNYGFVTYYNTKDAFNAIENGSKIRQPNELPFDLCFGGRRQFCKTNYADLDSNQDFVPSNSKRKFDALDFDTLLKQAQKNLKR